jgi:hypothetical protein
MKKKWTHSDLRNALEEAPQEVTIDDVVYTCYTTLDDDRQFFVGIRGDSMQVFTFAMNGQVAAIDPIGPRIAHRPWSVSAEMLVERAKNCEDLTEQILQDAVSAHVRAGLLLLSELCGQLYELLKPTTKEIDDLRVKLNTYQSDGPASLRAAKVCGEALYMLVVPK